MRNRLAEIKKIFAVFLIAVIIFFLYFFVKLLPYIFTKFGQKAYDRKDYVTAYHDLKMAIILNPKNRNTRYYYVQTLINFKPTLEIQKDLFNISEMNLADSADLISDRQISKWRNQIFYNIGENYIEQVPFNNKILRWDALKFPLKVYIKNNSSSAPEYYKTEIQKAFLQWQTSSNNLVRFNFISNEEDANILVIISHSVDMSKCSGQDCKYVVAYTTPTFNDNLLKTMPISFYDTNNLGKPFSQREIYNTALHEIGHSLGIMGHSYNKDDIMYMETNQNQYFNKFRSDFQLISEADINTLNLLYKLIPDITNTPLVDFDTSYQFFAPIVIGGKKQINSRKMLEAENYIKAAPELPNGYIDLALAYLEAKQYNTAIETLNQALSFCSNDNERFVIYYNLSLIYIEIKDWENSLKYANMAKQINSTSDVDGIIAAINYNMGKVVLAKMFYYDSLKKNPDNIINAYNLATIYIRELNLVQAGKVLNNLVKVNPDARSDPRIKNYGVIIFLFR